MPLVARHIRCRICPRHYPNITGPALTGPIFVMGVRKPLFHAAGAFNGPRSFALGCGGFSISVTAPVVGSIFLTGEAAPDEPSNSLSSVCLYSAAARCL